MRFRIFTQTPSIQPMAILLKYNIPDKQICWINYVYFQNESELLITKFLSDFRRQHKRDSEK